MSETVKVELNNLDLVSNDADFNVILTFDVWETSGGKDWNLISAQGWFKDEPDAVYNIENKCWLEDLYSDQIAEKLWQLS